MGFLDDYFAASFHAQAIKERAEGGTGAMSDAFAISSLRRSVGTEMQAALSTTAADISRAILQSGRLVSEAMRRALQGQEHDRRAYEADRSRSRASLMDNIAEMIAAAKRVSAQTHGSSARELFLHWARLRESRAQCVANGLDDSGLILELSECTSRIVQSAESMGLPPFDDVLAQMAAILDELQVVILLKSLLEGWAAVIPRDDSNQFLVPDPLREGVEAAYQLLVVFESRCRELAPKLRSLAEQGALVSGETGEVFAEEFAIFDGPRKTPDDPVVPPMYKPFSIQFQHDDPQSPFTLVARILAHEKGMEMLLSNTADLIKDRCRSLVAEKRKVLDFLSDIISQRLPNDAPMRWRFVLRECPYLFSDLDRLEPIERLITVEACDSKREQGLGPLIGAVLGGVLSIAMLGHFSGGAPWGVAFAGSAIITIVMMVLVSPVVAVRWWKRRKSRDVKLEDARDQLTSEISAKRQELDEIESNLGGEGAPSVVSLAGA